VLRLTSVTLVQSRLHVWHHTEVTKNAGTHYTVMQQEGVGSFTFPLYLGLR